MRSLIFLCLFFLFTPNVTAVNYVRYVKLYIKNTATGEVQPCFPRDFHIVLDPQAGYIPKDGNNFVSGFTTSHLDVYDCPASGQEQEDIETDAWGCSIDMRDTSDDSQTFFQFRLKIVVCNEDYEPDPNVEWVYTEIDPVNSTEEFVGSETFDLGFNSSQSSFGPYGSGSDFFHFFETEYFPADGFGPPSFSPNLANLVVTLRASDSRPEATMTIKVKVNHFNPCVDAGLCSTALSETANDPSPYLCPLPWCPPTWDLYSQTYCYQALETTTPQPIAFPSGAPMERIQGLQECVQRRVDPEYCWKYIAALNRKCRNAVPQNFKGFA